MKHPHELDERLYRAFLSVIGKTPDSIILQGLAHDGCSFLEAKAILKQAKTMAISRNKRISITSFAFSILFLLTALKLSPNNNHELPVIIFASLFFVGSLIAGFYFGFFNRSLREP